MANKDYSIKVGIEGKEKLKDDLKDVRIETIKALSVKDLMKALTPDISEVIKNIEKIPSSISKLVPIMEGINKMNKEVLKSALALATSRLKQVDEEIKSLKKIPDNVFEINKAYKAKEEIIIKQSEITKTQALQEYAALMKSAQDKKDAAQAITIIEQQKADKLLEIDNNLKESLKKNTGELKKVQLELLEPVKDSNGFIDIDATKANIDRAVEALKKYKTSVLITENDVVNSYNLMIAAAGNDEAKVKELTQLKETTQKNYAAQVKEIDENITKTQDKENGLRLKQIQGYMLAVTKQTENVKKVMTGISDYFSTAFTAVSNAYGSDIKAIEEEIKQNKVNVEAAKYDAEKSTEAIKKLQVEQTKATEQGQTEKAQQLQTEIDYHNGIIATKAEYDKKDKELNDKKAKKQKEQEKIDKLNRKAALIKSIGEATASVAQGITKALAYGPFIGPVLAAVVGAAGAVQIGIMTKQLAKFEDGGLLRGKRHSQGGMRIEGTNMEVEGGEFVVNRVSTDKNLGLVKYINEQRRELSPSDLNTYFSRSLQGAEPSFRRMFADGGQLPAINNTVNVENENLIKAIQSIRIEPKVAVTDIAKVQENMVSVDGWAGV